MIPPFQEFQAAGAAIRVFPDSVSACEMASEIIASCISTATKDRGKAVLGLATGATPEPVYARLIEAYKAGSLSFEAVTTFNLDEYYPMGPLDPQSYRSYMDRHLFAEVDLAANRAHVLDGTVPEAFAAEHGEQFDRWIAAEGGLDLQLLGLGRNGHIGFNEPTDLPVERAVTLPTRLVDLHPMTLADAIKDFGGAASVPRRALTMGIASILAAQSIVVLAFGERKAPAVARSIRGPLTAEVPGSLLQTVSGKVTWLLDGAAAELL